MLEGFDDKWVNAGKDNIATYTKIPPGHYTLKINATNTAGEWSNYVKTLSVIITPPFWQTWWFIGLLILSAAVVAWFLIQTRINHIKKDERQKIKFEHEASELKAQALRAQMNPHFIFNCLNSIKALIQEERNKEAVIYLTTFSKLIRNQLNNAEQEISLHDELETCKLYAQLETLRFGDKIVIEFKIDKNVDTYSLKVPPLLLQPFIENAIWHGVLPKQRGKVTVLVEQENGSINCTIDDDGIGREMAMNNKLQASSTYESKGMGLVKNRLALYNNLSANRGSIEVIDKKENNQPAGTLVIIKFKQEV
jgi:sensor histidine kinase YesM